MVKSSGKVRNLPQSPMMMMMMMTHAAAGDDDVAGTAILSSILSDCDKTVDAINLAVRLSLPS